MNFKISLFKNVYENGEYKEIIKIEDICDLDDIDEAEILVDDMNEALGHTIKKHHFLIFDLNAPYVMIDDCE